MSMRPLSAHCVIKAQTYSLASSPAQTMLASMQSHSPPLVKLPFLSRYGDPSEVWKQCKAVQANWEELSGRYSEEVVQEFRKRMVAETISITNFLEDTLPDEIGVEEAKETIKKAYPSTKVSG